MRFAEQIPTKGYQYREGHIIRAWKLPYTNLTVKHGFASESNENATRTIEANATEMTYGERTERNNKTSPSCDLCVAGYPCQPFFTPGHRKEFGDESGRGVIFDHINDYIQTKLPKTFLLENVPSLVTMSEGSLFDELKANCHQKTIIT